MILGHVHQDRDFSEFGVNVGYFLPYKISQRRIFQKGSSILMEMRLLATKEV